MKFDPKNAVISKVENMPPSGIRKFFDIVYEMKDAISLGVGEPDFVTPWHIRESGIYSLEKGHTYYSSNSGLFELRQEISNYLSRRFDLKYNPADEVIVTVGGSEAIDLCIRALVDIGDEVLIPEPSFVCYKPCTILAGGTPVCIQTEAKDDFKLTPEKLREKITDKTKLLILPFPNNPTGAIMTRNELAAIVEVLKDTKIAVLSDELYAELTYVEDDHASIAQFECMKDRTVHVNGLSKAYAMTGWRIGYACGHKDIIGAMFKIHQYAIMCSPTVSQYAAIEALKNGDKDVLEMKNEYDQRRKVVMESLKSIGLDCFLPYGAFYAFPSIKSTGLSSEEFCEKLLFDQKVAVVPGTAFGESGEGFIRLSYAYSIERIEEAFKRMKIFVEKYRK